MSSGPAPARNRLDERALAPLVAELHRRFSEGRAPSAIVLRDLPAETRRALADLLGADRLPPPDRYRLPVDRLLRSLALPDVDALRRAVEQQSGPIVDRSAARLAVAADREAFWDWFEHELAGVADQLDTDRRDDSTVHASLDRWAGIVRSQGIVGGTERHRARLGSALAVLRSLCGADGIPLPVLAAEVLGDPHGLDRGRSVARLVLDALAALAGSPPPLDAEGARQLWESAGAVPDAHSSTVLVLGLRPHGGDALSRWLSSCADQGEPAVVSLAHLRRWPVPPIDPAATVYVVENPSILAHAAGGDRRQNGPVIVCSSGRPSVAVVVLIRQLAAAGAAVRQHADFDHGGLGITAWLQTKAGTVPWCMDTAQYRVALAADRVVERRSLGGALPQTPWDPPLREAMTEAGFAVFEEEVRDDLLAAMT